MLRLRPWFIPSATLVRDRSAAKQLSLPLLADFYVGICHPSYDVNRSFSAEEVPSHYLLHLPERLQRAYDGQAYEVQLAT